MNLRAAVLVCLGFCWSSVSGHEVRPGYLEITEVEPEHFSVVWKQPVRGQRTSVAALGLRPVFSANCERQSDSRMSRPSGALIEHFLLKCEGGLAGRPIAVEGLQKTITDVLVRLIPLNGEDQNLRLTADRNVSVFGQESPVSAYFRLGVEHLLFGYDHLFFLLLLVLLFKSLRSCVLMVTSFTIAHSITLAASVLSLVTLPFAPVEAAIALSILFVARELLCRLDQRSLIAGHFPYLLVFVFGLLHGFGFAGVLTEIGLPEDEALEALALFNLGLETGQVMVVLLIGGLRLLVAPLLSLQASQRLVRLTVFLIGSVSACWFIQRSLVILMA